METPAHCHDSHTTSAQLSHYVKVHSRQSRVPDNNQTINEGTYVDNAGMYKISSENIRPMTVHVHVT